jgi:hypothetical protein
MCVRTILTSYRLAPIPSSRKTYTNLWFGSIHQPAAQVASAAAEQDHNTVDTTPKQPEAAGRTPSPLPEEARSFSEIRSIFRSALLASRPKGPPAEEKQAVRWAQTTVEELKRRLYETARSLSTEKEVPDYIRSPYKQLVVPILVKAEYTPFLTELRMFFEEVLFAEGFHAIVAAKRDGDVRFLEVNIGFGNEWIGDKGGIEEALWRLKEEIVGPAKAEDLWLKEQRRKVLSRNSIVKRGLWEHEFLPVPGSRSGANTVSNAVESMPTPVASPVGGETEDETSTGKHGEEDTYTKENRRLETPINKNSGVQLSNDNGGFKLRQDESIDPKLINGDVNVINSHGGVEMPITEQRAGMRGPSQRVGTLDSEAMDLDSDLPTDGITSPSPQRLLNGVPLIILSDSEDEDSEEEDEEAAPPWAFSNLRPLGAERKQKLLEERIAEMGFAGSNEGSLYP